jgi:TatD DNase family protein
MEEVKAKALEMGVDTFIAIGASDGLRSCIDTLEIAKNEDNIFATIGIHPHDATLFNDFIELELNKLAENKKVIAIGEIGLDYYYDHSPRELQIQVFKKQLDLAKKLDLPIIIHTRDAEDDTIDVLSEFKAKNSDSKILFHCFSGSQKLADFALSINAYISFSGIITFKKAEEIRSIVENTPIEKILVETDSPYLAPVPFRGKKNHPAFVSIVAKKVSEIKNIEESDVISITRRNTIDFFNLDIK